MLRITVFHGAKYFAYESLIPPMIGDIIISHNEWDNEQFKVINRQLVIEKDSPNRIIINVAPRFENK